MRNSTAHIAFDSRACIALARSVAVPTGHLIRPNANDTGSRP